MSTIFDRPDELIRRVYSYVAYRIGPGPEAEDVTSATVERAYRYRANYDPSVGEPIAWLIGIATRCIRDAASAHREVDVAELDEVLITPDPSDAIDERITMQQAVATLSERDRDLIALRYGADLSARQIAKMLGSKTNTVEVALHRALGRLRAKLEVPDLPPVASSPSDAPEPESAQASQPTVPGAAR